MPIKPPGPTVPAGTQVRLELPQLADRKQSADLLERVEKELIEDVLERQSISGSGHVQGDWGQTEYGINELMDRLSVLRARLGDGLEEALEDNGKIKKRLKQRIEAGEIDHQPLERSAQPQFKGLSKNPATTPGVLKKLYKRRVADAKAQAEALSKDPAAAADASNNTLQIHGWVKDSDTRARILADTLLQFRATWRSDRLMDEVDGGSDTTQGKLASTGIISTLEARMACQEVPTGTSLTARRERALTRLAVTNLPYGTVSGLFYARNLAGALRQHLGRDLVYGDVGKGRWAGSAYHAVHSNYSAETPALIDRFLRFKLFTDGPEKQRLTILRSCVEAAGSSELDAAKVKLARLEAQTGYSVPGADKTKDSAALKKVILDHLAKNADTAAFRKIRDLDERLEAYELSLAFHRSVCEQAPSDVTLSQAAFYGKEASRDVAALIDAVQRGDHLAILEASGSARLALQKAFKKATAGYDRQMLWKLDRQVEQLAAAELGTAVSRISEPSDDPKQLGEALVGVRAALRHTLASGLDALRPGNKTVDLPDLDELQKRVDTTLDDLAAGKKVTVGELRTLMLETHESAVEVGNAIQIYFKRRERAVYFSGADVGLDPNFCDNLVKESGLHYLLGLTQAGATWGVRAEVSDGKLTLGDGVKVVNPVGPAVYERVLFADSLEELARLEPTPDDLCVLKEIDQKERTLVAVGGLVLDAKDTPPGFSHISVFARGAGISAVAFPNLVKDYLPFFKGVQKGKAVAGAKLFVDDSDGKLVMMPLSEAVKEGRVKKGVTDPKKIDASDLAALRPGANYEHRYVDSIDGVRKLVDSHSVHRSDARETRTIDVLVPNLTNEHGFDHLPTLDELGALGSFDDILQNAGMKGAVLADLRHCDELKELGVEVPGGAVVPPYFVAEMLRQIPDGDGSLFDAWLGAYTGARDVPTPDDFDARDFPMSGLLDGRFYRDPAYRRQVCSDLQTKTRNGLNALLLDGDKPTAIGQKILDDMLRADDLQDHGRNKALWIDRSSQTLEDLRNKSGAGQYTSMVNLRSPAERLAGLAEVIASHWGEIAIQNNVAAELNLLHNWPSVPVQRCVSPSVSGVAVSRGRNGELGTIGYQAVKGFGGAVDGAQSVEISYAGEHGTETTQHYKGSKKSLLTREQQQTLRAAMRVIEKRLNNKLAADADEPVAIDVEWAIVKGELCIYQARFTAGY